MTFPDGNLGSKSIDGYEFCLNCYLKALKVKPHGEIQNLDSMELHAIEELVKSCNISDQKALNSMNEFRREMNIRRNIKTIIYLVLICISFIIFNSIFSDSGSTENGNDSTTQRTNSDDKIYAYLMSQKFVERKLVAPATAKFPSFYEVSIEKIDDNTYKFNGYVDAQNSFGALLRTNYMAHLKYNCNEE